MKAALPYPIGINVLVFRDDGNWHLYRSWFLRTQNQIETLFVARITLGHYEGTDEPAYSHREWIAKSEQLVEEYPDCVFIYGAS